MDTLRRHVRDAVRALAASPGFTLVAVVTLALGIGANTAVFSALSAVLLRPLPFAAPERLVAISETNVKLGRDHYPAGAANVLDWTARKPRAADVAAAEALADVLAAQRRAEDCLGSEAMLRPVRTQIAVVEELVTEARGQVRPRLVHVVGQWAQSELYGIYQQLTAG